MGGRGSGRRQQPGRVLVEEAGAISLGKALSGLTESTSFPTLERYLPVREPRNTGVTASIVLKGRVDGGLLAELRYNFFSADACVRDRVVPVNLVPERGRRGKWMFLCPGAPHGLHCGTRTRSLYTDPSTGDLVCRTCAKLRYLSQQTHPPITEDDLVEFFPEQDARRRMLEHYGVTPEDEARVLRMVAKNLYGGLPKK